MSTTDPAGAAPTQTVRASDDERSRIGAVLREAAGSGRLTDDELQDRLATLQNTRYRNELGALTDDLPTDSPPTFTRKPASVRAGFGQLGIAIAALFTALWVFAARHKLITALIVVLVIALGVAAIAFVVIDHGHHGGAGVSGRRPSR